MIDLYGHARVLLEDPSEEEWLAARHRGIGGSEVAAVLGMSSYDTNLDIYMRKLGLAPEWEANEAADLGHLFEDTIARAAAERLGLEILGPDHVVLLQHPTLQYLLVTPDRICRDQDGRLGPLEVKMTAGPTVSADWDDDATPHAAALQLHHQLVVTGHEVGWVGALVGGYGHRIETRTIEADQGLAEVVTGKVSEFWQCVQDEVPPAPKGPGHKATASVRDLFDALGDTGAQEIDTDTIALVDRLADKRAEATAMKKEVEHLTAEVGHRLLLAESDVGLVDGQPYVTYRPQSTTRVKPDLVKAAFPDTWDEFAETTETRVLRTPRKGRA